jgi:NADH-quinone oxidoreductase subunit L
MLVVAAFMTAVYMTRMMLYTFHGPNRTGDAERRYLREVPPVMLVPLVALGALSVVGGWLNVPPLLGALGPVGALERWLEPVVGAPAAAIAAGRPEASHGTEMALVGLAVLVAAAGIALAVVRLRPAALRPKAEAPPDPAGIERTLAHAYYVDDAYDAAVVQPALFASKNVLSTGLDTGIIDRVFVIGIGWVLPRTLGKIGSALQSGRVGNYAWVLVLGVIFVLGAFTLR